MEIADRVVVVADINDRKLPKPRAVLHRASSARRVVDRIVDGIYGSANKSLEIAISVLYNVTRTWGIRAKLLQKRYMSCVDRRVTGGRHGVLNRPSEHDAAVARQVSLEYKGTYHPLLRGNSHNSHPRLQAEMTQADLDFLPSSGER